MTMLADEPSEGRSQHDLGPWLEVRTGTHQGVVAVSVLGEIDLANHEQLKQLLGALDLRSAPRVDLDLSQLSFSDARGACHLLDFVEHTRSDGAVVQIIGTQPALARLLGLLTKLPDTA